MINPRFATKRVVCDQSPIPMSHEHHRLLHTKDGEELADFRILWTKTTRMTRTTMLRCLRAPSGTIPCHHVSNNPVPFSWSAIWPPCCIASFGTSYDASCKVPYTLITSNSDFDSPLVYTRHDFGKHLNQDAFLLKLYGIMAPIPN
jgi:hypothetical protein